MARVIDTNPAPSSPAARVSLFDRGGGAAPTAQMIDPARSVGGVSLPPGKLLEKAVGDPNNGQFFSWDAVMQERGAPIASCDADGTPTMIKGEVTGKGSVPGLTGRMHGHPEGCEAEVAEHVQQMHRPDPGQPVNGIPFADELASAGMAPASANGGWIDWAQQDAGVRSGLVGGLDPVMAKMSEPPRQSRRGHVPAPPPAHFSSPSTAPGSTPSHQGSLSPSSAMMSADATIDQLLGLMSSILHAKAGPAEGRGAGEVFTYGEDDEDSKEGGDMGAKDGDDDEEEQPTAKSIDALFAPLEALIKGGGWSRGPRGGKRKKVGGKWVYEGSAEAKGAKPAQTSLFGDDVMRTKQQTKRDAKKPAKKPSGPETSLDRARKKGAKLSAAAKRSAAKDGNLKVLFASESEASAGRGASASDMEAIAANFAQAMSVGPSAVTGEAPKYGMAAVYAKEGIVGLRRKLEQTTSPRKLTRVQVDGVMNRSRHLAAKIRDGMAARAAEAKAGQEAAKGPEDSRERAASTTTPFDPGDPKHWKPDPSEFDHDAAARRGQGTDVDNVPKRKTPRYSQPVVSTVASDERRQQEKIDAGRREFEKHGAAVAAVKGKHEAALKSAIAKLSRGGRYSINSQDSKDARRELRSIGLAIKDTKLPRTLAGKRAHEEAYRDLANILHDASFDTMDRRDRTRGNPDMTLYRARDAEFQSLKSAVKPITDRHWSAKRAADKQEQRQQQKTEKSMDIEMIDPSGRALPTGLAAFAEAPEPLAKGALYDYLRAFVELSASRMMQKSDDADVSAHVMVDLVRYIGVNPELARASAEVGGCTKHTVERILAKGEVVAPIQPQVIPWFREEAAPVVERNMADRGLGDVSHLVKSDNTDPFADIQARQRAAVHGLWAESAPEVAETNIADNCPVHGGRDLMKSMALWNPMQPCTCAGEANAYG